MRILIIGAHPDDAEGMLAGVAALYSSLGHRVLLMSMTDGSAGHQSMPARALIRRRRHEAQNAARILGAQCQILNNRDGRLFPDLKTRADLIGKVRTFGPDIIFTHPLNDYHPDHRYTVQLVYDISYLLAVPGIVPDAAPMKKIPVICHCAQQPEAGALNICIPIDAVWKKKILALHQHASQMYEWLPWVDDRLRDVPKTAAERIRYLEGIRAERQRLVAEKYRQFLKRREKEKGDCAYLEAVYSACVGVPLTAKTVREYFPFRGVSWT